MKRILLLFFMFVLAMTAVAQRTQKITYQAVVRDAGNRLVVYTPVRVDVTITSSTGSYFESLRDTTNANGLMYVLIGGNPGFEDIDWVEAVIKTVITIDGGESVSDEVTVTAVPLALQASYATNVSPTAPTIVAVYNQIQADSLALANQIAAERAHLDDTLSHYLMQEVQVLSISNDTIYLTGGSFVKLPAGFSGDYNDLIHKPDLTQFVTNVHLNDTLGHYPTIQTLNDTLSHYLMHEEQVLSVSNDTLYLTGGSWVKLPQGFSGDYNDLANKPDLNQYTTNAHLNDTLSHYYTNTKINDTLAHYLRANDLCDSIVKCDIFQNMRDSIQINATNIANNTTSITNNTTNITNNTTNITNITNNIANLQLVDSTLEARIVADSTNLANNYYNKDEINDTLSHYLKEEVQALRISNDTIYLTGGSFVKLPAGFSGDYNDLTNVPTNVSAFNNDAGYLTSYTEVQALRISNDTIYLTGGSFVKLPAGFSGDYNDLTNAPTKSDLCDSVKPCVTEWISDSTRMVFDTLHSRYTTLKTLSDSLRHYTTLNTLNDTLNHYLMEEVQALRISNDTIYLTGGSFVKLPAGFSGDYNDLTNVPTNVSAFNNDAGYLTSYTEVQALRISNDTIYLTGGSFVKLPAGFSGDYNDLTNVPTNVSAFNNDAGYLTSYTEVQALRISNDTIYLTGGSFVKLPAGFSGDYNELINRPNLDQYATNTHLNDTLGHYLQAGDLCDSIVKCGVIQDMRDSILTNATNITNVQTDINNITGNIINLLNVDSVLAAHILSDSVLFYKTDSIILARIIADSTNLANNYYNKDEINDTLSHYLLQEVQALRISNDTIYLTGGSFVKLPAGFSGDYNDLTNAPTKSDLCDSVKPCVTEWISDSTRMVFDTLHSRYTTLKTLSDSLRHYTTLNTLNDTLSHYMMEEVQALRISNDTIYLTGGSFVKLPAGFSGDYNDLTNAPTNVSAFNNDAGYLTSYTEVQALRISNDTIYLTGGSFVKLPAGFSGDYNDLTNAPTNVSAFNNDAGYLTSDSAVIVNLNTNVSNLQGDVTTLQSDVTNLQNADNVLSSRITTDSTALATRMDTLLKHVCDSVKPCVTGWISDSTRMVFDTLHSRYTTLKTLSDSLRHYTTLNTLNDTLNHYLMEEVQALRISNDTIYLTGGSFVKLPAGFSGDYNELINRPNLNQYVTNTHLNDTLGHYLQVSDLCDSIMKCGAIQNMHDSIQINTTNISNNTTNITNITNNITSITTDLHAVDSILNARITTDSTALANRIHIDSTALATRMDTLLKHVCDSVQECVTGWISDSTRMIFDTLHGRYTTLKTLNDSLSHYTTTNQIDTLIKKYGYLTSDSAVIVMMRDSIQKVNAHVVADSLAIMDTLHRYYATNDTLNNYYTRYQVDTAKANIRNEIQNGTLTITYGSTVTTFTANQATGDNVSVTIPTPEEQVQADWKETDALKTSFIRNKPNIRDSVNRVVLDSLYAANSAMNKAMDTIARNNIHDSLIVVREMIHADSIVLATRMDTLLKHVCDSVQECVTGWISDSTRMIFDTLHGRYTTLKTLSDTLSHYTTTNQIDTLIKKYGYLTSDSAVIVMMRDSIQKVNAHVVADSLAIMDTLHYYYVTNAHLNDTLGHYTTTDQIDTLLNKHHYLTSDSTVIVMMRDSIYKVNNRLTYDSTALAHRMDTLLKHVCDSVQECVTNWMGDTLKAYTTTNKIDTLIKKYGYLTSDSAVIVMMRDSIQKVNAHVVADSLAIMDTLHKYYATNDTLNNYYTRYQVDTAKAHIRSEIQNGALTITYGTTTTTFTANQPTGSNVTVEIPTPAEQVQANWNETDASSKAYIQNKPDLTVYATKDALKDSTRMVYDTLHRYYATKDTLKNFLTISGLCDSVMSCDGIENMRDSIQKVNAHVVADSLAIMDTLHRYYVTNAHLNDTLGHYTTTDQIDTLLNKHHYLTSDSTVIVMMRDSIQKVNAHVVADSIAIMDTLHRYYATKDTLKNFLTISGLCDSVMSCDGIERMRDSIQKVNAHVVADSLAIMDTLHRYYVTNAHMNDTLGHYTTTDQIDTLLNKHHYLTSDSTVIVMMRDSIQKVNAHVVADSLAIMDTLHKYYATNDTLNNYYTRYQVDTAKAHIRNEIQNGALTITYGGVSTTFTANQPTGSNVTVEIPTPAEQVQANWNETDASSKAYIQNKPDLTVYATKDALKDSTRMVYDTLHRYYATKDTLKNFLTISGLCDSVMSCDGIERMRDSIQKVNAHVVADSLAIMDTLHRYYVTNAHLNDTLGHYTTTDQIDTLLNKHHYLTSDSTVIVMMRDSIQKVNAHVVADSIAIMDTLHRYYATKDTLKNFLTISGLCDSVMSCDGIERMRDSIQKVNAHVVADSLAIMDTLHYYYVTNAHLNDTLGHYTTTDQIDTLLNKHHYLTSDSTVIVTMRDSIYKVNNRLTYDSTALAHRMDTLLKHVCDSVQECVTNWMGDTLKAYTTTNKIDTLIKKYGYLTSDSAVIVMMRDSIQKVNAHVVADSLAIMDTLHYYYVTNAHLNDTLGHYTTTDQIDTLLNKHHYLTSDSTVIVNMRDSIYKVNNRLTMDSTVLAHRMDTLLKHVCDSVQECVTGWIKDSTRMVFDTLHTRYTTLKSLNDTLGHYTTTNQIDTLIKKYGYLTSDSAVIVTMRDSIYKVNNRLTMDSTVLAHRMDTLLKHVCDSVQECVTGWIKDSTSMVFDTLHKYYATKDTLKNFEKKSDLCKDVMVCIGDTLGKYTTTNQIDTLIKKYGYLTSDSAVIVTMRDSIYKVNNRLTMDSTVLAHRMDTLLKHVCDSVQECVTGWIKDSTSMVFDTLHKYYATKDTLKNFEKKSDLCKDVMVCIGDTLGKYTTTNQIDTLIKKYGYLTSDSAVIVTMRDSIYKVNNRLTMDSTALAHRMDTLLKHVCDSVKPCVTGWISDSTRMVFDTLHTHYTSLKTLADSMHRVDVRIKHDSLEVVELYKQAQTALQTLALKEMADSLTLATRMDTVYKHLCDSVMNCDGIKTMQTNITDVTNNLDSSKTNIRNEISSLNTKLQSNIDSTSQHVRSALKDTAAAIRNSIGNGKLTIQYGTDDPVTFNANQKTDTSIIIPVPTAPNDATLTIQKNGTTVGTFTANQAADQTIDITVPTCDSLAECDLIKSILARLDKLERQNDSLAKEIEKLQPALTVTGPQKDTVCSGSTKPMTFKATFHNCSSSDYTLAWKVNGVDSSAVTGPQLVFNAEAEGNYEVVCIATRSDSTFVTDTVTTTVSVDTKVPFFTVAIEGLTVTLSSVTNTETIQWDTDSLPESFTSNTHVYSVADTISITATSKRGCTFTKDTVLQPISPVVTTDSVPANTIAATTAKAYGTVTSDGGIPETKRGILYSTSDQNLEYGANGVDSVVNGTGKGNYACTLERLVPCTQYYVRAFAYNEVDTVYGAILNFTTPSFTCGSTLYDIDGNDYATLLLGSQCWMKQNLRTSRYADGDTIQLSTAIDGSSPARYMPTPADSLKAYGYLYNWAAAARDYSSAANPSTVQGACPAGWHLPSDAEWTQLTAYIASDAANVCDNNPEYIIKSMVSGSEWCPTTQPECFICYNPSSNNHSEFSVRAAGTWNNGTGDFGPTTGYTDLGHTIFTTSTAYENPNTTAWAREFYTEHRYVDRTAIYKTIGLSVRCVLDKCDLDNTTYAPTLSPVRFTDTVGTTVTMAASVISDGSANVTERGVCWGTSPHPTVSGDHAAATSEGIGDFIVTGNLTAGDTYYVRAYAINDVDTAYGAEVIFVMPMTTKLPPTVNTGSKFLALSEGFEDSTLPSTWTIIDADGDGNNWYRESMKAKTGNGHAASASAIQTPQDDLIPLSPNNYLITPDITIPTDISAILTFWYSGFYYRSQEHFLVKVGNAGASSVGDFNTQVFEETTSAEYEQANFDLSSYAGQTIRLAFIHNNTYDKYQLCIDDIVVGEAGAGATIVSDITGNSAICGGYVSNDGGATVTARGVCWSTSQNPTARDSHTTDGGGTGSFTSNITGLNPLTTYYVRAYAINSADTSYGSQVSFNTTEALPEVTTSAVSNISGVTGATPVITANCGGNVTEAGAYAVTARGVCWSTSQTPTISDSHTTDGSGLGSFTSSITGLTAGATYYVRAYATNSAGTAYGNQVSFTTPVVDAKSCPEAPIVTDHEGNIYATVQIGTQCWMRENLRTTTSPKTGTYLVNKSGKCSWPIYNYTFMGTKVAHWPSDDSTSSITKGYGLLYNWCAAMDTANPTNYVEVYTPSTGGNNDYFEFSHSEPHRGICPVGWHVPSNQDWDTLTSKFSIAGKLAYGNDWKSSNTANAPGNNNYTDRNISGFTALPAGKFGNCNSDDVTERAYFWGSGQMYENVPPTPTIAKCVYLDYNDTVPRISHDNLSQGLSVRCVRDEESGGETSLSAPEVSTGTVSAVTTTSATAGGEVTSDGGASVSGRGVCWNTLHNPTISDSHTTDGNGTGSFTSTLTGLIPGTTYYVRAYATNSEGTAYGNEMSFTTLSGKRILLDTIQHDYVAKNGDTLVNTLSSPHKISIADGATVTLRDAKIIGVTDENATYPWAGITCLGDATIILEDTNIVKGFYEDYPGIYVPQNKTLTIEGTNTDSLDARSNGWGAGIGGGAGIDCGNIIINGGKIGAYGGACAAGIGSGYDASCGNISITEGTVVAEGGQEYYHPQVPWYIGAGIGTGFAENNQVQCGDITISGGTVKAIGGKGGQGHSNGDFFGAGIGTGYAYGYSNTCGDISISGGNVTAIGAHSSAGIGTGYARVTSECGDVEISGGTVIATGGYDATGIGNGRSGNSGTSNCGSITIGSDVTIVTATKGGPATNIIGLNNNLSYQNTCGDLNIDPSLNDETSGNTRTITHQ